VKLVQSYAVEDPDCVVIVVRASNVARVVHSIRLVNRGVDLSTGLVDDSLLHDYRCGQCCRVHQRPLPPGGIVGQSVPIDEFRCPLCDGKVEWRCLDVNPGATFEVHCAAGHVVTRTLENGPATCRWAGTTGIRDERGMACVLTPPNFDTLDDLFARDGGVGGIGGDGVGQAPPHSQARGRFGQHGYDDDPVRRAVERTETLHPETAVRVHLRGMQCSAARDGDGAAFDIRGVTCGACLLRLAARETVGGVSPTGGVSPAPPPSTTAPLPFAASAQQANDEAEGMERIDNLVRSWLQNFGVDDAPQPDRVERLIATFAGFGSGKVWTYLEARGGLTRAVYDAIVRHSLVAETNGRSETEIAASGESSMVGSSGATRLRVAKRVALNMVQVGTAARGFPLDQWIEACVIASPGEVRDDGSRDVDDSALRGPMVKDTPNRRD